jgi:hypothetical protein
LASKKIGLALDNCLSAFACGPVFPGLRPGAISVVPFDKLRAGSAGLVSVAMHIPRTDVLGYSQPELSKLARKWPSGRRNLLNAWKRTWTSEIGLMLWQCFRPSISTLALVEMDGRSCRELLEGRAHSRSLGYARDDKVEGGGPPWHEWRWMDRVEKKLIWTRLTLSRPYGTDRRYALIADLFFDECCPNQPLENCEPVRHSHREDQHADLMVSEAWSQTTGVFLK